jgi:hypothetical protein
MLHVACAAHTRPVLITEDEGGCTRVAVSGPLDADAAKSLAQICARAGSPGLRRLELDLSDVTLITVDGVAAVGNCMALSRLLVDGVSVTVANDAGRRALLDSLLDV